MDISSKINLPQPPTTTTGVPHGVQHATPRPIGKAAVTNSSLKFRNNIKDANGKNAPKEAVATSQSFSVTALSSLLFNDSEGQETKKRQVQWGNDLLDQLESLRIQLISGNISREHLSALSEMLKNKHGFIVDPELENIIREIETRVAVELAKLGYA